MSRIRLLVALLALAAGLPARGDPPPPRAPATDDRKVLRPGEVEVRGKARRPTAPPITPPNLDTREPGSRRSFLPRIVEAVDAEPFVKRPER